MRNYEIVFLVHPDQSDQTSSIISKLEKSVNDSGGNVHRAENIGNRKLAYPIQDQFKASYGLLNIECNQETIDEIKSSFKFNDSIIRNLILSVNKVHKDTSALLTQTKEDNEKDSYQEAREAANKAVDQGAQAASKPVSSADVTKSDKPKDTKEEVKEEAE
jgi:small subunit ribosomal protein S6